MTKRKMIANNLYDDMLFADSAKVAEVAARLHKDLRGVSGEYQLLGIAALLLYKLHQYGLSHIDVLGMAECCMYSEKYNNLKTEFSVSIKDFCEGDFNG